MLWILLFLPLLSFAFISLLFLKRHSFAASVSIGVAILDAVIAIFAVAQSEAQQSLSLQWLEIANLRINIGFLWDPLAQWMTILVTFIGALIHIYSWGYMKEDPGKARYFAYLSLFMFSMLGIVLANNFVMLFIFWELVSLSSYLLIGFWFEKPQAVDAGKKAFLVNKVGDFGFIIGIVLVWTIWHTVDFQTLSINAAHLLDDYTSSDYTAVPMALIILLLFCGVLGKSAQIPLHVWLPDAMEGPTPISALIHAATMVAAGVYLLCRIFFLLTLSPVALNVIAWTGGITCLFAALWAIAEDDIKRILAYSTISQLGYMILVVGLGSPGSAMFHLSTHACFKALLFLGVGSVLIALQHEQNIWKMGGLGIKMPFTTATFLLGLLALCGVEFSSGALSKDEILAVAYHQNQMLFWIGSLTTFLTAFYMGRLFIVVFMGETRDKKAKHICENGLFITFPLLILAFGSIHEIWRCDFFIDYLRALGAIQPSKVPYSIHALFIFIPFLGLGSAWTFYHHAKGTDPLSPFFRKLLASKFRFDESYDSLVNHVQGGIAYFFRWIDLWIIDGLWVKGGSLGILCFGNFLRCFQSGNLQTYILYIGLAVVMMIYWTLIY